MPTIYLAGPEVFRPDADAIGRTKKRLCAAHGFEGLWPLDNENSDPARIAADNLATLRLADAVIANLSPFRGVSADPGTVFEVGYAAALGKPVYAFTTDGRDLADRVAAVHGRSERDGRAVDGAGLEIEDFGLFDNLMIPAALAGLVRNATDAPSGFAACLRLLASAGR